MSSTKKKTTISDEDIEKQIEYEIRCGVLMQHMFNIHPSGPGGDTWETSIQIQPTCSVDVAKDTSTEERQFVDFVQYDKPIKICGCAVEENAGMKMAADRRRSSCSCWKPHHGSGRDSSLRKTLNTIRPPQLWKNLEGVWKKQISGEPITRKAVLEMNEMLDTHLEKHLAQERGVCPARRHLFNSIFDEMIRQEMIISPERGLLLMRVKDELKMSLMAYEALYDQGRHYGMQKRLMAERMISDLQAEHDNLIKQTKELKNKIKALNEEFKDQKLNSELAVRAVRYRAKMELEQLQEIKLGLSTQLNQTTPEIEKIEKERRLRQLH